MRHKGVENDIEVHEISVPVYERSGWVVVDEDLAHDGLAVDAEQPTVQTQAEDGDQVATPAAVGPVAVTKTTAAKSRRREGAS